MSRRGGGAGPVISTGSYVPSGTFDDSGFPIKGRHDPLRRTCPRMRAPGDFRAGHVVCCCRCHCLGGDQPLVACSSIMLISSCWFLRVSGDSLAIRCRVRVRSRPAARWPQPFQGAAGGLCSGAPGTPGGWVRSCGEDPTQIKGLAQVEQTPDAFSHLAGRRHDRRLLRLATTHPRHPAFDQQPRATLATLA